MKHSFKLFLLLLGLAVSLSACTAGDSTPTLSPTEGVQLLAGTYITTLTESDIAGIQSLDPGLPNLVGDWRINFSNDGKFDAEINGQWVGSGMYTVKGSEITISVSSVCNDCPCDKSIGRYRWALRENQLVMVKAAGTCDLMHAVFTTHPLTR